MIDGVVFSGGKPLLQAGLAQAVRQVQELGFAVAAGAYPLCLGHMADAGRPDWVSFNIKATPHLYERVTAAHSAAPASRSLRVLLRKQGLAENHVWQETRPVG